MPEADYTATIQYVQAQPGYDVLVYDPKRRAFDSHPVVAWAILHGDENFICAQPITVLSWSINDDRSVRMPSGEVVCDERVWPTAETWLAEMKSNEGKPLALDDIMPEPTLGGVLALDSFRNRFREQQ